MLADHQSYEGFTFARRNISRIVPTSTVKKNIWESIIGAVGVFVAFFIRVRCAERHNAGEI